MVDVVIPRPSAHVSHLGSPLPPDCPHDAGKIRESNRELGVNERSGRIGWGRWECRGSHAIQPPRDDGGNAKELGATKQNMMVIWSRVVEDRPASGSTAKSGSLT